MAHARMIPLLLTTLALVLVLPGAVFAGESKEFSEQGTSWTVPDGWQWMELNSDQQSNGYYARAATGRQDSFCMISLRSIPNDDPNFLEEHTEEVRAGIGGQLSELNHSSVGKGSLAGIQGTVIKLKGKNRSDAPVYIRIYGIQANNRIHQAFVEFIGGSESSLGKAADAARRGFKLASGGGEEPADPDLQTGKAPAEDEGDEDEDGDEGDGPSRQPKRGANSITFDALNLKWTYPSDTPFELTSVTPNQKMKSGEMCEFEARVELEVSEDAAKAGAPTENTALVTLILMEQREGWSPKGLVENMGNHEMWEKQYFDEMDYGRLKTDDKYPIGNFEGAVLMMVGKKGRAVRYFRAYFVALKGKLYRWEVVLTGNGSVNDEFRAAIQDLMDGVEFLNTKTWVRGPLAVRAVAPHDQARGTHVDKDREIRSMGFTAKKPKPMACIKFAKGGNWRLAWEMRSEDKQQYLYFDVQTWSVKSLQGTTALQNFEVDRIKEREGQWRENVESPTTVKKGKEAWFKSSYGKGRGLGYEFKGYQGERPFIERGFVVKFKKYYYWIRIQLGGEGAEKAFSKQMKALKKGFKYSK